MKLRNFLRVSRLKGMSATLKILFGALLMIILLALIVFIANSMMTEGVSMMDMLSVERWVPNSG